MAADITCESEWIAADDAFDAADARALRAMRAALPPGRIVTWEHGDHERRGEVVEIIGHAYKSARVRVRSVTGSTYDVDKWPILGRLR